MLVFCLLITAADNTLFDRWKTSPWVEYATALRTTKQLPKELPEYDSRPDLRAINLDHADLSSADLSGVDLSNARLWTTNLSGARLSKAKLTLANLTAARLAGATLDGSDLTRATLRLADLTRATLDGAALDFTHMEESTLTQASLIQVSGEDVFFTDSKARRTNFAGAKLHHGHFQRTDLSGASFAGAMLNDSLFGLARLENAYLGDASLLSGDLRGAVLRRAYLGGADLSGARIEEAELDPGVIAAKLRAPATAKPPTNMPTEYAEIIAPAEPRHAWRWISYLRQKTPPAWVAAPQHE